MVLPELQTGVLGGVEPPGSEELAEMQASGYILRARNGQLTKLPAEKVRLPHDPNWHPQWPQLFKVSDRLIYARQRGILSKSTDGGHTWDSTELPETSILSPAKPYPWQALRDGTFRMVKLEAGSRKGPLEIYTSEDEGRSWEKLSELDLPGEHESRSLCWLTLLPDDSLLCDMHFDNAKWVDGGPRWESGLNELFVYRTADGGSTWEGPSKIIDYSGEGGITALPSGRLLAVKRHQRGILPDDPPDLMERSGSIAAHESLGLKPTRVFKHIALADSDDNGRTWHNQRLLTTVFGQCNGFPAAQSDGTVVVLHDTRYGPGPRSGRAMISRDEGQTWENEVYYVYFGKAASSYSQSVVLEDDTIVTACGSSDHTEGSKRNWNTWIGYSDMTIVRWKPAKD